MWCIMKVGKVENTNSYCKRREINPVAFKAGIPPAAANQAAKKMHWLPRFLMYAGQNDGEILNTLVTFFGTAVVAPIFIAGNPISKEDKETKWYSAMRQPISAVIAACMQVGVNKAYDNFMYQQASLGRLGSQMDLQAKPEASYLRRIIKLQSPGLSDKEISEEIQSRQNIAEKIELYKLRKNMEGKEVKFEDLINIDSLKETKDTMTSELEKTYENELKQLNKKQKENFLKPYLTDEKVKARNLSDLKKNIEFETTVKYEIRKLKAKYINVENASIDMAIDEIKNNKNLSKDVIERIIEKLEKTKTYEIGNGKKAFSTIIDFGKDLTKENVEHYVKVKKLLKTTVQNNKRFFRNMKNITAIFVSLVTLPISCGLLNWAYPRVMEKVMPKIQPWIHRNDPNWTPENAKKYGPPPKIEKVYVKAEEGDDD